MNKIIAKDVSAKTNWLPFKVGIKPDRLRSIITLDGIADRLRLVAFAEIQAREAFLWAASYFQEAEPSWQSQWKEIAADENRHAQMLLDRLYELNVRAEERTVSTYIINQCLKITDPILFLFIISTAEERGMDNGLLMSKQMHPIDEKTAKIFATIAEEEKKHIALANSILINHDQMQLRERAKLLQNSLHA